ncbi:MAG: galactokinase, partial [Bacteroidetes Order II. Incertae sedis bacterium]|nr:galactokinase [Bacteroidetes Order II. bacterium]
GQFLKALNEADLRAAGSLLSASHESSKSLFENSTPEMDFLVAALSANEQVYGARLSGAGWGGAVLALVSDSFLDSDANRLADVYQATFDVRPKWWRTTLHEGARRESH